MMFRQILTDLANWGVSMKEISDTTGMHRQNLWELRVGKIAEPRYSVGVALLALHKKYKRKEMKCISL